jgi:hypothetical protein
MVDKYASKKEFKVFEEDVEVLERVAEGSGLGLN